MAAELEILDSPRYLAGSLGDLQVTVYRDGTLVDPTGPISVTVTDEDGTVLSSGAASIVGGGTGVLSYTPTAAAMANVNRLTVTWAGVVLGTDPAITLTTRAEVVGDMLFTEAEARAFDNGALSVAAGYTDDAIRRMHDAIFDDFEVVLRHPLGRRYFRETVDGRGNAKARLSRSWVRSIRKVQRRTAGTQTWTDFTSDELLDVVARPWGLLERETRGSFEAGVQNYRVSYEAGKPIAGELRRCGLRVLRHKLIPSNLPDRALYQTNEIGQFRLAVAGDEGHWFGIPEVDAVLMRLRERKVY